MTTPISTAKYRTWLYAEKRYTEQGDMQKSAAVLRRYYNTQTLEHIEGMPLCVLQLADVRQYDIGSLFLGLAIHRDDQVVVTSVIT